MTKNNPDEIVARLQKVLRPQLRFLPPNEPLPMGENLGKLGLDSMAAIDLLTGLEEEFGVQIPDSLLTADTFQTADTLLATLQAVLVESAG